MNPSRLLILSLLLMLLVSTMYGCGWRLRGSLDMDLTLPPLQLQFQQASADLKRELTQNLESAGVELNDSADLLLVIHKESQGRRVLSVDSSGKVSEYELQYELVYSLRQKGGETFINNERITQVRDYEFDEDAVLAKGEEEQRLFEFMRRMSIQTLMRRLHSAMSKQAETAEPEAAAQPAEEAVEPPQLEQVTPAPTNAK